MRSVLEKRWVLSVPKPCFHVDTAPGIYVISDGEFCRSLRDSQQIQLKSLLFIIGLDGEFCPFFMLEPLEKFTVCQYIVCYDKKHLQDATYKSKFQTFKIN